MNKEALKYVSLKKNILIQENYGNELNQKACGRNQSMPEGYALFKSFVDGKWFYVRYDGYCSESYTKPYQARNAAIEDKESNQ